MNEFDSRPTLRYPAKIAVARKDPLRETGESGDAYDAEAQTEAELVLGRDV